jgi:competence protein ComEA
MIARTLLTLALAATLAGEVLAAEPAAKPQVNINSATAGQLQLLPRVGPALAARIVEFRTANGPFKAPEELMRVKGIGEKSFALLEPYVIVKGETTLAEKQRAPRTVPEAVAPAADDAAGGKAGKES